MVNLAYDSATHVLVGYVVGQPTAAENEVFMAEIDKLDRNGRDHGRTVAMLLVLGPDAQAPDAHWRRRFAEQRKALVAPVYASVVTTSAVLRGVLTAMNWMFTPPSHVKTQHHATFEEGAAWIERSQGTPQATLRRLYEEVLPRVTKAG
jgi:hypothetical protein